MTVTGINPTQATYASMAVALPWQASLGDHCAECRLWVHDFRILLGEEHHKRSNSRQAYGFPVEFIYTMCSVPLDN